MPKGEVPGGSQRWGQVTRPNRCPLWTAGSLVWGQLPGGGALAGGLRESVLWGPGGPGEGVLGSPGVTLEQLRRAPV